MLFRAHYLEFNGEEYSFHFTLESLHDIPADAYRLEYLHNIPDYLWC